MLRLLLSVSLLLSACNAHQEAARPSDAAAGGAGPTLAQPVELGPADAIAEAQPAPEGEAQVAPAADGSEAEAEAQQQVPAELPVDQPTPQMLYDQCKDRLEGPQVEGECSTDADCATAGCSQEVCLPAAKKGEIMTTCEILPCFGAVEACGCHEGLCTWSLKDASEPVLPRLPIQVQ